MKKWTTFFFLIFLYFTCNSQEVLWEDLQAEGEVLARHENALVAVSGKILLLGGRGDKPIDIYNIKEEIWTKGAQPPFEIHHMQAVALDGLVYIMGAFTGSYPYETPISHVLIYDVTEDFWAIGPEIPATRRRGAAGVVTYNSKIYVVNGIINGHTSGWVNWLDEFDPYTNTWTQLPDAPVARDHFQAEVINDRLFVAGGRRSGSGKSGFAGTVKETNIYNFTTQTWGVHPGIPTERAGTASAVWEDKYVVIGGESDSQEASHKEVEAFSFKTNNWSSLTPLTTGRHGTQAISLSNSIILGAGSGNRGGGPELTSFEILSAEEKINLDFSEIKELEKVKLITSEESINLKSGSGSLTVQNPSEEKAVVISYLQLDNSTDLQLENNTQNILPPKGELKVAIKNSNANDKKLSAILFIKILGNSEPLQIQISNKL